MSGCMCMWERKRKKERMRERESIFIWPHINWEPLKYLEFVSLFLTWKNSTATTSTPCGILLGTTNSPTNSTKLNKMQNPGPLQTVTPIGREVILARLRIEHSRLTHSHLLNSFIFPPSFPFYNSQHLTISRLFTSPNLSNQRSKYGIPNSLSQALHNVLHSVTLSLEYLCDIQIFPLI